MKMSLCAISPLVHPVSSLVFPSCLSALLYTTCLRLVVICRHLPIRNVNVDVLWMNEKAIRYYLSSSHRNICVYMCIHVWLQWYLWVCALIVFLCVHVSLSVHVHAHFQLSSARQSLQCDTQLPNFERQNGNIFWACYKQVDDNRMRKLPVINVS